MPKIGDSTLPIFGRTCYFRNKLCSQNLASPTTQLINLILINGEFPDYIKLQNKLLFLKVEIMCY
jgi:hypothetical protein